MNENLDDLKKEIAACDLSEENKSKLQSLVDKAESEEDGLMSEFNSYIESFEESHPQITSLMNKISNFLSNAGI